MEGVEKLLQTWQLHPVADHFTIALLTVAILFDIFASIFPARSWIRHSALTLMILGAVAAASSYATGDMEADRVWDMMSQPVKAYFHGTTAHFLGHGTLGYYLMFVFAALAIWRILLSLFGFLSASRPFYLIIGIIAIGFLLYQGHTGGELVYEYGVGTGPMAAGAAPVATATRSAVEAAPTVIPTVFVPTPTPTASPAAASPRSSPTPNATATPAAGGTGAE